MWFLSLWEFHLNWIDNIWLTNNMHLKTGNVINSISINEFDTHHEILSNIYFFIPKTQIVIFFTLFMLFGIIRVVMAIVSTAKGRIN